MMQGVDIKLADERVSWKAPSLFNNDWVALSLAQVLNPLLPKPLFSTAYGCPACAWAGGRAPRIRHALKENELRRYFEAYRSVGAACALTFSRPDAGDFLDDAYCDLLLALVDEYAGQAIVVDERLARHIRETHPDVTLVASYNLSIVAHARGFDGKGEERFYRDLLALYDEIVVRNEAMLEGGISGNLVDVADRIEVIVNQSCAINCPDAAAHIAALEDAIHTSDESERRLSRRCTQHDKGTRGSVFIAPERRAVLADRGFVKFKIQGRNAGPTRVLKALVRNILAHGNDALDLDEVCPIMEKALSLDLERIYAEHHRRVPLEELTRIPESLA